MAGSWHEGAKQALRGAMNVFGSISVSGESGAVWNEQEDYGYAFRQCTISVLRCSYICFSCPRDRGAHCPAGVVPGCGHFVDRKMRVRRVVKCWPLCQRLNLSCSLAQTHASHAGRSYDEALGSPSNLARHRIAAGEARAWRFCRAARAGKEGASWAISTQIGYLTSFDELFKLRTH
eukprot:5981712-Pleurochrysis_carterae.AAC.2